MKAVDDCYEERFLCFEDVFDDASDPSALRSFVVPQLPRRAQD